MRILENAYLYYNILFKIKIYNMLIIMLYIYSHIDAFILVIYYIVIVLMENLGFQQKTV